MGVDYSVETCKHLAEAFDRADLERPIRTERYDAGTELTYEVTGVLPGVRVTVRLVVDKFVGGGFAGQVYRVKVAEIDAPDGEIPGLEVGGTYAIKILVPPSAGSQKFRDAVYAVGFQSPFQLQTNPAAARAGALWQKFIRRAASIRMGSERAVVDILATFVDSTMGSCGEISEWVAGRTWRFEVDDRLDLRKAWRPGDGENGANSPEYRAKKAFMADFVKLLHEVGAHEFARQYEWWTCKSQPNALKRLDSEGDPAAGLTAVDFRAGLALLPFLPMAPGDVPLIFKGLARGSLVQFDRGNLKKLQAFVDANPETFADMAGAMAELRESERIYRDSLPDITHNHVRLLYSPRLWGTMLDSAITGWSVRNIIDEPCERKLRSSKGAAMLFRLVTLIPLLALAGGVAVLVAMLSAAAVHWATAVGCALGVWIVGSAVGRLAVRLAGRADYRKHYWHVVTSPGYFIRAVRGRIAERAIAWHRAGRLNAEAAERMVAQPWRLLCHLPVSLLPAGLHRAFSDWPFLREKLAYVFVRPVRLYFNADAREQWLRDMLDEGRKNGTLSDEDYATIESRIKEPFIQKYLKSLAVHVCTLPVTQIVSVAVAWIDYLMHPELPPEERALRVGAILVLFQITPISPGSMCRGLYVLYLVIRERNYKDYNVAVFLGFFKYIGYLAFPIQMAYRYPALARFMAGHWATGAVHIIPVFGEQGALAEHGVFDLFYNYPLTVRRRMKRLAEVRGNLTARIWHAVPVVALAGALWAMIDTMYVNQFGALPTLKALWFLAPFPALLAGAGIAKWVRGGTVGTRVKLATVCGLVLGILAAGVNIMVIRSSFTDAPAAIAAATGGESASTYALLALAWRVFWFTILAVIGALAAEITASAPDDPRLQQA